MQGLGGVVCDSGAASEGRGEMAPRSSSARVRNSSRHAIYHRRRSGKLLYKRISSAGRAGEVGLHGPWAVRRGRGHRWHPAASTGWEGRKALGMGPPVPAGLCPRTFPVSVTLGAQRLVCQPALGRRRHHDAPGNRLRRHVTCVSG